LFFSYFKDLVGKEVTVELKNDLAIRGTLHSVDQYLNIKLENTRVVDQDKYPHMVFLSFRFISSCFTFIELILVSGYRVYDALKFNFGFGLGLGFRFYSFTSRH
jgi:small nuclear ribonucleoprotein (snRNP)-like protein